MKRIATANRHVDLFGAGKDGFRASVPGVSDATYFSHLWANHVQEALARIREAAGIAVPADNDFDWFVTSINKLIESRVGDYSLDTGAANAYVIAQNPAVVVNTNGMEVKFRVANANTGASTLNAGGGAKPLRNNAGAALASGDLPIGTLVSAAFDGPADVWLINSLVTSQAMSQAAADARYLQLTGGALTGVLNGALSANIASASTINLTTATGNLIHITGTTPINVVTLGAGMERTVIFDAACPLNHHATNNNLPGGQNITAAAGDRATYYSDGTTVYCVSYVPAATPPGIIASQASVALPAPNTPITFTHGLGGTPRGYSVRLVCISTNEGYAVDDEIDVTGVLDGDGGRMTTSWVNATVVGYITSLASGAFQIRSRVTNGSAAIDPSKWTLTFRAWK